MRELEILSLFSAEKINNIIGVGPNIGPTFIFYPKQLNKTILVGRDNYE